MRLRPLSVALRCTLTPTRRLQEAERALEELARHVVARLGRLPTTDLPWSRLMRRALEAAPWRSLPDSVLFLLNAEDPLLDGRVAIVLGNAYEQHGFTVFPSLEAHIDFHAQAMGAAPGTALDFDCQTIHLSRLGEEEPAHIEAARARGLVQDGFVLSLTEYSGGTPHPLDPGSERAALQVVEAILTVWDRVGPRLAERPSRGAVEVTPGLRVEVTTMPSAGPLLDLAHDLAEPHQPALLDTAPRIIAFYEQGLFGATMPTLIVKYGKPDATRAVRAVGALDAVSVEIDASGRATLDGWIGPRCVGPLTVLTGAWGAAAAMLAAGEVRFVISAGGARRRSFAEHEFLLDRRIEVLEVEGGPDAETLRWRDPDPQGLLPGASWAGDVRRWPKASAVLHAFLAPLDLTRRGLGEAKRLADSGAAVWNAVVRADAHGSSGALQRLLAGDATEPATLELLRRLVERKRRCFPQDTRQMVVTDVRIERDALFLVVTWTNGADPIPS
jgi:hypothetical protein